ncbi:MAG TPA: tail fiber protein [Allosphingosinicella sp.]|nr:tail fiber protein [Allosphingosinicella sp.]
MFEAQTEAGAAPATLAMAQLVATNGWYPTQGFGQADPYFTMGMIHSFAGTIPAYGAPRAEGQSLPIMGNQAFYSLVVPPDLDGEVPVDFNLPDLNGRAAVGAAGLGTAAPQSLPLTWLIATGNSAAAPLPGMLAMFVGSVAPDGWLAADGRLLGVPQTYALFEVLGTAFGGNGTTDFALPDLNGAAPVGAGQGAGVENVGLGQKAGGAVPGVGLNYLIALTGTYPRMDGNASFAETGQYIGQVLPYAGSRAPAGWAFCDGSLLQIDDNVELFNLIGSSFGGDDVQTFALPDLRGRMLVGQPG